MLMGPSTGSEVDNRAILVSRARGEVDLWSVRWVGEVDSLGSPVVPRGTPGGFGDGDRGVILPAAVVKVGTRSCLGTFSCLVEGADT